MIRFLALLLLCLAYDVAAGGVFPGANVVATRNNHHDPKDRILRTDSSPTERDATPAGYGYPVGSSVGDRVSVGDHASGIGETLEAEIDLTALRLSRKDDFLVVHLSNAQGDSDLGVSQDVELMIQVVSKLHLSGDGPVFQSIRVPDDGAQTVEIVKELYAGGVRIFLGPETSGQATALADWAEESAPDAVFFSFAATNPALGNRPNILQLMPTDITMARNIVDFQVAQDRVRHISIIHNDGVYASGLARYISQLVPRVDETCVLEENEAPASEFESCVQRIATSTPPEDTLVVLLTSGRDTREALRAAYKVYGTDAEDVLWIGADTVAYDSTIYDEQDPDVWTGAQIVNLHGISAGANSPKAHDVLSNHFWRDFVAFYPCEKKKLTSDTSPTVLIAADAVSMIFLNAGGALTGAGANLEELRLTLLRQIPFLYLQSGAVRFNLQLQRIDMSFVTVRVRDTDSPDHGLWILESTAIPSNSQRPNRDAIALIPPKLLADSSQRKLEEGVFIGHDMNNAVSVQRRHVKDFLVTCEGQVSHEHSRLAF